MYMCARVGAMAGAHTGRISRPTEAPTELLQARVSPESRAACKAAAAASGATFSYYMDTLIQKLVKEHGSLPLVDNPRRHNGEELPIPDA